MSQRRGARRKFLYKGVWVLVIADGLLSTWMVAYNKMSNKENSLSFNGKFSAKTRRDAFRKLRITVAEHLDPRLKKVKNRVSGRDCL